MPQVPKLSPDEKTILNKLWQIQTQFGMGYRPSKEENLFLGNYPGGSSQAYDKGENNVFVRNYWDDHDNRDKNGDGIADAPYAIDPNVNNQDPSPLAKLPVVVTELGAEKPSIIPSFTALPALLSVGVGIFLVKKRKRQI